MTSLRKKISTRFKNRFRLIIRKDEDLEEKISLVLTPLNLILLMSGSFMAFGILASLLFAYTPLGYLLPEHSKSYTASEKYALLERVDSLEKQMGYMQVKSRILDQTLSVDIDPAEIEDIDISEVIGTETQVKSKDVSDNPKTSIYKAAHDFFTPLQGVITDTFNINSGHYAVDIVSKENSTVKSTLDGTVVHSGWNPKTGHTIMIQHNDDYISVYKHNSVLLKKEGTFVNAGDAIALVGNSGELTSGPHLHFELWNNGTAVNPMDYIVF